MVAPSDHYHTRRTRRTPGIRSELGSGTVHLYDFLTLERVVVSIFAAVI